MKALLIAVPILLVGGVLGAGFMGAINIPGVTPKKEVAKASEQYGEGNELEIPLEEVVSEEPVVESPVIEEPKVAVTKEVGVKINPERGARELAKYWGAMETKSLLGIIETFDDKELALVLSFMPKDKVADILTNIDPKRAATLCKELRRLASIVKVEVA